MVKVGKLVQKLENLFFQDSTPEKMVRLKTNLIWRSLRSVAVAGYC
jgi:hypothetical protein